MQAIILAAGMGRRLRYETADKPKCLVQVNNKTLLEHSLENLARAPLKRIVLVVGYNGDQIRVLVGNSYNGIPILYIDNPDFETTNNVYSLYLARHLLAEQDTLLLESDLIYEPKLIRELLDCGHPNVVVVDKYKPHMDGTVVKISPDDEVTAIIPNSLFDHREIDSYYKTVNIYKFSQSFAADTYIPFLEAYCQTLGNNRFYEQVLRVVLTLDQRNLWALILNGEKWYEIDSIADLRNAELLFADSPAEKVKLYSQRYGGYWRNESLLDFCFLVNPFFPPQRLFKEFSTSMERLVVEYPSGQETVCMMAGDLLGCHEKHLAVGNGASELIPSLAPVLSGRAGLVFPTFMEYPARIDPARLVRLEPPGGGLSYDASFLKSVAGRIDCLLLVNPDNPSGNFLPLPKLLEVIAHYGALGKQVVADESFVDFAVDGGPHTLIRDDILEENPHLVVVKSISKSHGVAGLRLGMAASSNADLIRDLRKRVAIWNINSFGEFYLQMGAKYRAEYEDSCAKLAAEREVLYNGLRRIPGIRPFPSQGNFILCQLEGNLQAAEIAEALLWEHEILIKQLSGRDGLKDGEFIRLAVRNSAANELLLECLTKILPFQ